MRLALSLSVLLNLSLSANDLSTCKSCHPIIYNEFQQSMHKKSTVKEDKVHEAIWERHPAKAKGDYKCAKCHAPEEETANAHQGITCISCHTITAIEEHPKANKNIYESKDKTLYSAEKGMENKKVVYEEKSSWLGLVKETIGSPYHDIDYRNENFYTGKMCMGCHSHKENAKGFDVCRTEMKGAEKRSNNCISCHMPKVEGSSTSIRESKTHAFHGFSGVRHAPEMLSKYVILSYTPLEKGFELSIENKAPHALLTHPLRLLQLRTTLKRSGVLKRLKTESFSRVIGTENKASMPWLATEVIQDNMIQGEEKRVISFDVKLESGDEIESLLGYYVVNPKASEKLKLSEEKEISSFIPLKRGYYKVP